MHMMKMDVVLENRFRVAKKCGGKTETLLMMIRTRRNEQRSSPPRFPSVKVFLIPEAERASASVDTHHYSEGEERGMRQALCFVLRSLPRSTFSLCAMSAHISRSDLLTE